MRFCIDCTLGCLAALLLFCSYSGAQETKKNATIIVVVKDANRSFVVDAQAKFVSRTIGETKTLVTDGGGRGVLELEPGTYQVIVTARGFRPLKSQISLNAGEETKIDLALEVAASGCPSKDCIVDFAEPMVEQEHVETNATGSSPKVPAELIGTWDYTSMTALKNGKPFGTVHFQPGQWTVKFNEDATWVMKMPSSANPGGLNGSYEAHGHDLDMKLSNGKPYYKYRFTIEQDGKVLVLTTKESTISAKKE